MLDYAKIGKKRRRDEESEITIAFLQAVSGILRVIVCLCALSPHFIFPANPGPLADPSLTITSRKQFLDSALAQVVANATAHVMNLDVDQDKWIQLASILTSVSCCAAAVNTFMAKHVNTKWEV